ncbi:MAG: hypothetical protein M1600_15055 [Firmicutes bacterium]|nr:hypothetical protein [Bacillota bacterium]
MWGRVPSACTRPFETLGGRVSPVAMIDAAGTMPRPLFTKKRSDLGTGGFQTVGRRTWASYFPVYVPWAAHQGHGLG